MSDSQSRPTVMVSGCFDLLHSGHVAFLNEAATHGRVVVCAGSDRTVMDLKGRPPINNERERAYMLAAIKSVDEARVSRGSGVLDFMPELEDIKPDIFFVNADGDSETKRLAIEAKNVKYVVADRVPAEALPPRSTTSLRTQAVVPYRLDLAGGWLDQPWVSEHAPGPVVGISLEPDDRYERRSGMASSTRQSAMGIWGPRLPVEDREKLAKLLFAFENPPGTKNVAGSQDAIAVVYPGLTKMDYANNYWPDRITSCMDPDVLKFIEDRLYLRFMRTRPGEFEVLDQINVTPDAAKRLGDSAERLWSAALRKDARAFGSAMTESLNAQVEMFPLMCPADVRAELDAYADVALGHKISGAGGGGYAVFFSEEPIPDAIRPKIRVTD